MTLSDEPRGLLAQIPDLSGEAVLIVAADAAASGARIVYANPALAALLGRPEGEILDQPFGLLRAAARDVAEFARLCGAVRRGQPIELKMRIAQGARNHWVEIRGHPLQGERQPYLVRLRDLSRQRALTASARLLQQRFEALSALTSDGIYFLRVGPDCRLALEWSAGAFERLTGYTAAEIERLGGWSALVEPADQRIVQRRAQRLLAGEDAAAEYRIRTRNGESRWLYDLGRPQWDEPRELVIGVLCAAREVTALRALEERLRAGEADWKALAGLAGGLVFRLDAEQRLVEIAGQAQGELGGRLRAGAGQRLADLLGDGLAETWSRQIARAARGWPLVHFDFSHASASGEESYRASLCSSPAGNLLAVLRFGGVARSDLAPSEAAPGAHPELAALLNLQPSAAVLLSPALSVAELNAAAEHLTGWQRAAAVDRPFVELMALASEQSDLAQDLERARQGERVVGSEAWLRLPGGQEGRIVWNYTPLLDAAGGVIAILAQGQALAPLTETAPGAADDQQRLKAIMDHVADGIVALDGRGAIVAFSGSAEVIFGYRRDEVLSRGAEIIVVQGPQAGGVMDLVIAASKQPRANRETLARRKGGEVFPIELAASDLTSNGDTLYILTVRDITLRKQTEETVRNLAYHDPLTGLPNRLLFNDRLSQAIERARRNRQTAAVMILDLDRFKLINDSLGMASGDQVLRAVGERLVATLRRSDTVARLGGDDFLPL
ncbi:MAG: PAS domain S-box protein, partial [Geminicoccaceae bacterium]